MLNHYIKLAFIGLLMLPIGTYSVSGRGVSPVLFRDVEKKLLLKVFDEYGKPLSGAKVYSRDHKLLGETDANGEVHFEFAVGGDVIIMHPSYYANLVKAEPGLKIAMVSSYLKRSDTLQIFHDKKTNENLLGAVSVLYNNQLKSTPTSLYLNALTGRTSGLYTQEISGFRSPRVAAITYNDLAGSLPSEATKYSSSLSDNSEVLFNLRGQQPVTIIDGVQREIYSIDPESIESITIAKDALSSVLLGQRSSRGILEIRTKKGVAGPPRISFTAQTGMQHALKRPEPLNAYEYAYLYNEALLNSGRQPVYSSEDFSLYQNGTSPLLYPNINWYDAVLKSGSPITKYNLSVNGGIRNARYALSLSYLDQEGMFNSSDEFDYPTNVSQRRYLINSSIDVDVTKDFTIGLQLFGRIQDGRQPGAGTSNILNALYNTPNNAYPIFNEDGSYGGSSLFRSNLYQQATGSGYLIDNTRDVFANLDFNYKFDQWLPGLYAKGRVNVSSTSSSFVDRSRLQPVFDARYNEAGETTYIRYGDISDQPNSFSTTSTANFFYFQGALGYDRQIDENHQLGGKIFVDQRTANYQFDLPAIHTNFAATGNYAYQQKYFGELAVNYSGFNRFQPGRKYGTFYAMGMGWDMAKESFISDNADWLDQLKFRATYGHTGNTNEGALGYYSWRSSYGQDGANGYNFGSEYSYVNSIIEQGLANINATWEKGKKFNIGLDVSLWDSMFRFTVDYYRDRYYDLLQQRGSTIELIGISYPNENIGENLFEGQEVGLSYQNHLGKFNYFITANASRMRTEVLYMNEVFQKYPWNRRTGMPLGQTFGYVADGLIQTQQEAEAAPLLGGNPVYPGDVKLVDLNDDGIINTYDQTAIGNTKPILYYGATFGFNIAGFDLSILLQGVANRTYQKTDYSFGSNGESQGYKYMMGRWTPETGESATYPRLTVGSDPTNTPYLNTSSYWTRSGEYLRVRNVDLGYTFPFHLSRKIKVSALRVFANAQNLFTFTPYGRLDPEIMGDTSYPAQRTIVFGVNIKL